MIFVNPMSVVSNLINKSKEWIGEMKEISLKFQKLNIKINIYFNKIVTSDKTQYWKKNE
jgi:hypothetical protein